MIKAKFLTSVFVFFLLFNASHVFASEDFCKTTLEAPTLEESLQKILTGPLEAKSGKSVATFIISDALREYQAGLSYSMNRKKEFSNFSISGPARTRETDISIVAGILKTQLNLIAEVTGSTTEAQLDQAIEAINAKDTSQGARIRLGIRIGGIITVSGQLGALNELAAQPFVIRLDY